MRGTVAVRQECGPNANRRDACACLQRDELYIFGMCIFHFFLQLYEQSLRALSNGKQFARVWLQNPGLTQENRFGTQSSKQFHTFLPD